MSEQVNDDAFKVDSSRWNRGPWDSEPNLVRFESSDMPCLILRHPRLGHLCGYVAVPPGHPWHGVDFAMGSIAGEDYPEVHGGVTYNERCAGHVCHVPNPGEPDDVWWLGFDAAHSGDMGPTDRPFRHRSDLYRTVEYMRGECESLAAQIAKRTKAA